MMKLRVITVDQLPDFVKEPDFETQPHLPITPVRATSQYHNPNARPSDPALVVAYNEAGKVAAYFGCLPEKLHAAPSEKVCWSSCWWADPQKGRAAVMPVFYKALQLWGGNMLFDALPDRSHQVLEKMGRFSFREIRGVKVHLLYKLHRAIPSRLPILAPLKNILWVVDTLFNLPTQAGRLIWKFQYKLPKEITVERISEVDEPTWQFIASQTDNELPHRSREGFNWIINHPWLTSNKNFTKSYHFSSHANHFENRLYRLSQNGAIIAFLWLTLRDGTARLPYCYILPGKETIAARLLFREMVGLRVQTFICFQAKLWPPLEQKRWPMLFAVPLQKMVGWTKTLDPYFTGDFYIQDGDGDGVFT